MALNFFSRIDRLIYDPIKGRVTYDLVISVFFGYLIFVIFLFFENKQINIIIPLVYSLIYILFNFTFGLYGRNRTTALPNKIFILFSSNLISLTIVYFTLSQPFLSIFIFLINTLTSISPRFFLNFNVERTAFRKLQAKPTGDSPILIVGGGGYIGSVLVEELLKRGKKVRVFDKFIYNKSVFKGIRNVKNLELIEGDISDIYALTLAVKDTKAIVHLAGIVGDPAAKIDEKLTRHVNIASTRLLKETAKAFGVEKFIFASSCSVYGLTNKLQDEKSKPKPISLYAKTKVDSERELLSDSADTFHPIVLRFATVFGHSRKPRFDLVANLFTAEAYHKKNITVYGGSQWRPFVHVRDIAKAIIMILESPNEKVSRKIFNVGDDNHNYKIEDLAKIIINVIEDSRIKINLVGKRKDKRDYRVSFKKISEELGFSASITVERGIKEIYKNFQDKKYKKTYKDPFYVNSEMTKELKREFHSKKYRKSHFSTIS